MPRFRYRMQNILDIKVKLEEQAKNEFAIAQARLNEEEDKKQALVVRLHGYEDESRRLREEKLCVRDLIENQQAQEAMKELISIQQVAIDRAAAEAERRRLALSEVMQERKMHEKLREKALEQYMADELLAETKSIDELTSYTYGRK